jgi:hypothetical protein
MRLALSLAALVASWVLLALRVEPVPTWFYVFAWYPTLVLLDDVAARVRHAPPVLLGRPMLTAFAWSPVIWLVFEAANFRLDNWYYVFLPHRAWERWAGIVLSFGTVVPALLLAERLLDGLGVLRSAQGRQVVVRPRDLRGAQALGVLLGALALGLPRLFFPLIWGAAVLLADPWVYRHAPSLSLIGDLEAGRWGRIGRLLLGGFGIGLIWESYNYWAQSKWIYTVPWLEHVKLFEMPPFGFLGFPVFALEAWALFAALCVLRVAEPLDGSRHLSVGRAIPAATLGAAFAVLTLLGMESRTISSTVPRLADLPGIEGTQLTALRDAGLDTPFDLAGQLPAELASTAAISPEASQRLIARARLVTLRGIGARHASNLIGLGVGTACDLATRDAAELFDALRSDPARFRPTAAEVRVWVRAAARACP